jgi:hypothetical protein
MGGGVITYTANSAQKVAVASGFTMLAWPTKIVQASGRLGQPPPTSSRALAPSCGNPRFRGEFCKPEEAPWQRRHRKLKFFWLVWSLCC